MKNRWFHRRPSDDEMREELEAHVAMRAEHDGTDEAAARRRVGNLLQTREAMRRVWIAEWWDALRQDARFTWRSWRRHPRFAVAAILVLALGLGASTALFAALDRVLFKPLPYTDPDRLVSVGLRDTGQAGHAGSPLNQGDALLDTGYVQVWKTTPAPFESTAAMDTATCDVAEEPAEHVRCGKVDASFLRVLGVRVALGRDFAPEDDVRGAPLVALISHDLWVRRYGADPHVIGRTLTLDQATARALQQIPIIGVLPAGFEMPVESADILLPFQLRPLDPHRQFATFISVFARLRRGVTRERAAVMLEPSLQAMAESLPPGMRTVAWSVRSVRDRRVGEAARVGWLLVGAVAVFLLIACVNVTNLMLVRVADRQREFAVRAAVGAGKARLAGLALAESLLLALTAGGVGLIVAIGLLRTFVALAPASIPGLAQASVDSRVFIVALVLVAVTGGIIGLWPAVAVFHAGGLRALRARRAASSGARPRVRFALVTTQIALTLALLGGSALLLRSLWNVVNVPLGFEANRVVTLTAALSTTRYPTTERTAAFFDELLARARAMPGAVSAALSNAPVPRGASRVSWNIGVDGRPVDPDAHHQEIRIRDVTSQYFDTVHIPLVRGRTFRQADRDGEPAAMVSASAARVLFPGERALGRRIRPEPNGPWYTGVGVSAEIRNGLRVTDAPEPEIYVLARRGAFGSRIGRLALRTTASPADAEAILRQIAADLDPQLPVTIDTVDHQVAQLTARPRFITWLLTAFATLALLLATAGLYSVASYLVTQRRRDIGVRMALGATPRQVSRQVVGEAGRWIVAGALLGCALGWIGTRALQSQLYDVPALDPWSWIGALLALALVLVVAVLRPARDAAHVDPVTALRAE
jgi:predicted permease